MTPALAATARFYLGEGRFHTLRFSVIDAEILRGGGLLRGARP